MILKCKICGGDIQIDRAAGVMICEYCGTKQSVPLFFDDDESARVTFDMGNNYLRLGEYDKAENAFKQLLSINGQEADVYWSLCMCKYGVTFVCDPATGVYKPTCNRTHYESILKDKNYLNALEFSVGERRQFYKESAETIDAIQRKIIQISEKEKPFDIFISYKEVDKSGRRTKDSVIAQEIYTKLIKEGYKVFFSRITLEDKAGVEYEPYIYAALLSSKVMLTVCSSREHIEAPWVKNEWSRFLNMRQTGMDKHLIALYFDMPRSKLPDEFDIVSAQDIGGLGYEQDLLRGIKKIFSIRTPGHPPKGPNPAVSVILKSLIAIITLLLILSVVFFSDLQELVVNNSRYRQAVELYRQGSRQEAVDLLEDMSEFEKADEMLLQIDYDEAIAFYGEGKYAKAAWAFDALDDFSDSAEMKLKSEKAWRNSLATVTTFNHLGSTNMGAYYIDVNGSVKNYETSVGDAHENLVITEHGKIVSLGDAYPLNGLYEDGYVANSMDNNKLEKDWENIIQITPVFNATSLGLTNKGNIVYGDLYGLNGKTSNDEWLKDVLKWDNIVSLTWNVERFGFGGLSKGALIGLTADGQVKYLFYENTSNTSSTYFTELGKFFDSLENIKEISVNVESSPCAAALDYDGVLHTFVDGTKKTYKDLDILTCEVQRPISGKDLSPVFIVDQNRALKRLDTDKVIIEDVVYLDKEFVITQSGEIYSSYTIVDGQPSDLKVKTRVLDVWLERK